MIGYCKGRVDFCRMKVNVDLNANQDILVIALAGPFNVEELVVLKNSCTAVRLKLETGVSK